MNNSVKNQLGLHAGRLSSAFIFLFLFIFIVIIASEVQAAGQYSYAAARRAQALKGKANSQRSLNSKRIQRTWPKFVPIVEAALPEDIRLPRGQRGKWINSYEETGMTFLEYVTTNPSRPTPQRRTIYLAPIGRFSDPKSMAMLQEFVSAYFLLPVKILRQKKLDQDTYNKSRKQYDADDILLGLHAELPADAFVCTAITRVDIFSGRLSSVYGLSYSDLRTSIVSTARIWNDPLHTREADEQLRLAKLVVHEICHNLGISHCAAHSCRMNGTMGFGDLEKAPVSLCGPCLKKLQWNIGFDNLRRYQAMDLALRHMRQPGEAMALRTRISRILAQRTNKVKPKWMMAARKEDDSLINDF